MLKEPFRGGPRDPRRNSLKDDVPNAFLISALIFSGHRRTVSRPIPWFGLLRVGAGKFRQPSGDLGTVP